jgi:hypothetical protein
MRPQGRGPSLQEKRKAKMTLLYVSRSFQSRSSLLEGNAQSSVELRNSRRLVKQVKSYLYRSGVAQRVPGGLDSQIFMTFGT